MFRLQRISTSAARQVIARRNASSSSLSVANIETKWKSMSPTEQNAVTKQLEEAQKADWSALSLEDKKAAYYIAFGPHGPREPLHKPGNGIKVFTGVVGLLVASAALFGWTRSKAIETPRTINKEWEEATNEYLKSQNANPISGISSEASFTVISYNILSDVLAHEHSYLYRRSTSRDIVWKYRGAMLLQELQAYDADVYCLQEMDKNHYHRQFKQFFKQLGYHGLFKKRTEHQADGCAVFVRNKRFLVQDSLAIDYKQNAFMNRGNVAIVCILNDRKNPGRSVCIANTHILFNQKRGLLKIAQIDMLLREMNSLLNTSDMPIVLCGDMNSTPDSAVCKFVQDGQIDLSRFPESYMSGQLRMPPWLHETVSHTSLHRSNLDTPDERDCTSEPDDLLTARHPLRSGGSHGIVQHLRFRADSPTSNNSSDESSSPGRSTKSCYKTYNSAQIEAFLGSRTASLHSLDSLAQPRIIRVSNVRTTHPMPFLMRDLVQLECLSDIFKDDGQMISEKHLWSSQTEFYVILDDLCTTQLSDGLVDIPNRLVSLLSGNVMAILKDLFGYEDGPRLRDRASHGEYNWILTQIPSSDGKSFSFENTFNAYMGVYRALYVHLLFRLIALPTKRIDMWLTVGLVFCLVTLTQAWPQKAVCDCGFIQQDTGKVWQQVIYEDWSTYNQTIQSNPDFRVNTYTIGASPGTFPRVFSTGNVYLQNNSQGQQELAFAVFPNNGRATSAGMGTKRTDILYGTFRSSMRLTGTPGTVQAIYYYQSDNAEIDLEMLSYVQKPWQTWFAVHPTVTEPNGSVSFSTHQEINLDADPTQSYHEYRFDWVPGRTSFYFDSQNLGNITTNVPSVAGSVRYAHWTDNNPAFSHGPPAMTAVMAIQKHAFFFNLTQFNGFQCKYSQQPCSVDAITSGQLILQPASEAAALSSGAPSASSYPSTASQTKLHVYIIGLVLVSIVFCFIVTRFDPNERKCVKLKLPTFQLQQFPSFCFFPTSTMTQPGMPPPNMLLRRPSGSDSNATVVGRMAEGASPSRTSKPIIQRNVPAFLNKLFNMVGDHASNDLIRWSEDGKSFIVIKHEEFAQRVLPRFFKHSNFSSFVRQLNMYGFHKVPHLDAGVLETENGDDAENDIEEFNHPYFQCGRDDLLLLVTRKKGKGEDEREREWFKDSNPSTLDAKKIVAEIQDLRKKQEAMNLGMLDMQRNTEAMWRETCGLREHCQLYQQLIERVLSVMPVASANYVLQNLPEAPASSAANGTLPLVRLTNKGSTEDNTADQLSAAQAPMSREPSVSEAPAYPVKMEPVKMEKAMPSNVYMTPAINFPAFQSAYHSYDPAFDLATKLSQGQSPPLQIDTGQVNIPTRPGLVSNRSAFSNNSNGSGMRTDGVKGASTMDENIASALENYLMYQENISRQANNLRAAFDRLSNLRTEDDKGDWSAANNTALSRMSNDAFNNQQFMAQSCLSPTLSTSTASSPVPSPIMSDLNTTIAMRRLNKPYRSQIMQTSDTNPPRPNERPLPCSSSSAKSYPSESTPSLSSNSSSSSSLGPDSDAAVTAPPAKRKRARNSSKQSTSKSTAKGAVSPEREFPSPVDINAYNANDYTNMEVSMNLGHTAFKGLVSSMVPTNSSETDDMNMAMYPPMGLLVLTLITLICNNLSVSDLPCIATPSTSDTEVEPQAGTPQIAISCANVDHVNGNLSADSYKGIVKGNADLLNQNGSAFEETEVLELPQSSPTPVPTPAAFTEVSRRLSRPRRSSSTGSTTAASQTVSHAGMPMREDDEVPVMELEARGKATIWGTDPRWYRTGADDGALYGVLLVPIVISAKLVDYLRYPELIAQEATAKSTSITTFAYIQSKLELSILFGTVILLHLLLNKSSTLSLFISDPFHFPFRHQHERPQPHNRNTRLFRWFILLLCIIFLSNFLVLVMAKGFGDPNYAIFGVLNGLNGRVTWLVLVLFQLMLYACGVWFRRCFTFGEMCVLAQAMGFIFMEAFEAVLLKLSSIHVPPYMKSPFSDIHILSQALIIGMFFIGLMLHPLMSRSRYIAQRPYWKEKGGHAVTSEQGRRLLAGAVYCGTIAIVLLLFGPWSRWLMGKDPFVWTASFVLSSPTKLFLCIYWAVTITITVIFWLWMREKAKPYTPEPPTPIVRRLTVSLNRKRKLFHAIAVFMFVPGYLVEPAFLQLSFAVALTVFIFLEYLRYYAIWPYGKGIHMFLTEFIDYRDMGPVILSHIYLLVGCASPVWIEGTHLLEGLSGVLTLGFGDAMASIIGKQYGRIRWFNTKKTIEGTIAFVASVMIGAWSIVWMAARFWNEPSALTMTMAAWSKYLLTVILTGILEAVSMQNDNLMIPLYMYSIVCLSM
ncbi:hypothetical protein BZG36_00704 [Bifiguratus adelaidae]|uniref:dolichol kinase n=1 Tax=Bifiguratus adelaidae TaxID=1938954 RepID=A0A261Y6U2_9FUNG|nr:hypothetical protein BZG36_00704 [Bifiguratus adelaidae]